MKGKAGSAPKQIFSYVSAGVNPDTPRRHCLPHISYASGLDDGLKWSQGAFSYVSTIDLEEWFLDPKWPPFLC
ncbi:protein EE30A [Proboscivirus elephantidbeta5]|uniref:Protein EE30A n=1 Tax=Elephant endotheliotropic herpesvirus 5 TaxID=768738 RepID=A0A075CZR3_9BETA|nr:protein EE30A [Elephant endotheliotropic herpesvirus 5]AHC02794.1 protein EE30A [Elephant endotheliotropic herpesvirus 5]